ncbi:hypothetical protein N657DRAFT_664928 [Parathielavia appendiculata]|uniref:Kinetochore protein fta4 n=1 Tax=Parathielavia appendiculata TaxID=2587402 RepID=A0AAN6TX53_9PEZI|nr:hypothetical protein N657DRAFT_664928 [Parathielavia appendiculata]
MTPDPPTVLSLKQSFLTAQTRLLSQPVTPTRAWHSNNNNNNENVLPEKAIDDALFKLNHRLQQHSRRVYAPQATRHVAEQIDRLYWNAAEAATSAGRGHGEGDEEDDDETAEALNLGADLADPSVIATLPLQWNPSSSSSNPLEAKRYAELAAKLHALAERKQHASARVARLRRMQALLEPFSPSTSLPSSSSAAAAAPATTADDDGGGLDGVQENLVTRNGAVEAELHRMRMLLARVGARVGKLKEQGSGRGIGGDGGESDGAGRLVLERQGGEVEDVEMDEQRKLGLLLEMF